MNSRIKQFVKERDAALLSMDREKILAYARKWGANMPGDERVFWAAVHKARTATASLPMFERAASKAWLEQRGFQSMDNGDVLPPTDPTKIKKYFKRLMDFEVSA